MLTEAQKKRVAMIIGSSAHDCEVSMVLNAGSSPVRTLTEVAETLHYMNANGIEKISHRKALMKAGRKALNVLGEM
ncbi:hypothetical protein [Marinobacter sp. UBA2678]|uniref:hypothetical protein n=1 Tax=Marinobacter TaxID=2742 RepID=UPI000C097881|nr:hypothetical protein [Marinobacter sp. UBA2678]MAM85749.1 hypothetical protein [Hahellaceae bacterium]MAZ40463.1 hypothetical protein [Legionellales bacterium]MBI46718.1 hypothetical protein [Marinobacter sp.]MCP4064681.1 hypothetical protein [Gammaproteobacteria bacterium]MBI46778.1 hypothetical protein [Marinobacter sp.]|tara:strand:- start:366 stop:593 length:228 start_codon:yes stop_codon:yes gene_type:complete